MVIFLIYDSFVYYLAFHAKEEPFPLAYVDPGTLLFNRLLFLSPSFWCSGSSYIYKVGTNLIWLLFI